MENRFLSMMADDGVILLDGAMGTMLQAAGLLPGERPDTLSLTRPEIVEKVHRAYLEAGSSVIYSNTFGANSIKLSGSGFEASDVVTAAVSAAKRAAEPFGACVALDIGPTGAMMAPAGDLSFEDAYASFAEMAKAGEKAGADLAVIETMSDLAETRAAILAVTENTSLPVVVSMSFERTGRTFTGCSVEAAALTLSSLGAVAAGINCSLSPAEILPIAERFAAVSKIPLIIKANAGLPDENGKYSVGPDEFAQQMMPFASLGVKLTGACCGSDPEYIRKLSGAFSEYTAKKAPYNGFALCTALSAVFPEDTLVAGGRINTEVRSSIRDAVISGDGDALVSEAIDQTCEGAQALRVNVYTEGGNETEAMRLAINELSAACRLPLIIEARSADAADIGLRLLSGVGMLRPLPGADLSQMMGIAKKYGAYFVCGPALPCSGDRDELTGAARCRIEECTDAGISRDRVICDCTCAASSPENAAFTVSLIKERFDVLTLIDFTKMSDNAPLILEASLNAGLSAAIADTSDDAMIKAAGI